ncbi:MAG: hypothetical protein ACRED8_02755, partial [Caulobacteraceae bacterium]
WDAQEWLSEVLFQLAFLAGSWGGVAILTAAAAGAAAWITAQRVAASLKGPVALGLLAVSLGLLAPGLLARPHILALPVMAAWTAVLITVRERGRAPPLLALPLMTLWANLHGGFAFGLALVLPFALEALIEAGAPRRLEVVRDWGLFFLLAVGAALLTPFGFQGLLFPLKLLSVPVLHRVGEWSAADFSSLNGLEVAILGLIALALLRPIRLSWIRLALLLGLIHLSLTEARQEMLLAIVGPMILARPIAQALGEPGKGEGAPASTRLAMAAIAVFALGARLALPIRMADSPVAPITALSATPESVKTGRVLNPYPFGGWLIFKGQKVFVDSRVEIYGEKFLESYGRLQAGDPAELDDALRRYDISWSIEPPGSPLVALLGAQFGWRRMYADPFAVVDARAPVSAASHLKGMIGSPP